LKINLDYDPKEVYGRGHNPIVRNVWLKRVNSEGSKYGIYVIGLKDACNVSGIHVHDSKFKGVKADGVKLQGKSEPLDLKRVKIEHD
jgi:hypothetical protein